MRCKLFPMSISQIKGIKMKILIASDIHELEGNCAKLIEACYQEQAKALLLLSDILDGNKEVAGMP